MNLPDCPRCGRERGVWPLDRGDRCSPKDWVRCIRPLSECRNCGAPEGVACDDAPEQGHGA